MIIIDLINIYLVFFSSGTNWSVCTNIIVNIFVPIKGF